MTVYRTGHIKRNPETGHVAMRTSFDENEPLIADKAWLGATQSRGPFFAKTETVEEWEDIYVPPAEEGSGEQAPAQ